MPEAPAPPQDSPTRNRPIRSFVRREGRLTPAQAKALNAFWPAFGIDHSRGHLDLDTIFARRAPRTLEIGFGNGDALAELAGAHPERDYLGIEVHRPGVGRLLRLAHDLQLRNLRVICHDAVEVLTCQLAPQSLDEVLLFFPDPWPKKRHHKRRIVQPEFVALVAAVLRPGGSFHMATDWEPYAEHMREVMSKSPGFGGPDGTRFLARPAGRPETKFEVRGRRLGHAVWDLVLRRT